MAAPTNAERARAAREEAEQAELNFVKSMSLQELINYGEPESRPAKNERNRRLARQGATKVYTNPTGNLPEEVGNIKNLNPHQLKRSFGNNPTLKAAAQGLLAGKRLGGPLSARAKAILEQEKLTRQANEQRVIRGLENAMRWRKVNRPAAVLKAQEERRLRNAAKLPVQGAEAFMNTIRRLAKINNSAFNLAQARAALNAYNKSTKYRPRVFNNKNVKILRNRVQSRVPKRQGPAQTAAWPTEAFVPNVKTRTVKVNFPPNIGVAVANAITQAIKAATTPAAAKKFVQNTPRPAQVVAAKASMPNVPPAVAKAMNPDDLAKAIIAAIEAGVKKIPPKVVAPALTPPAKPANSKAVARALDPKVLAEAIVEAIRQGLKVSPEVIKQKPAEEIVPEMQKAAPNTGKVASNVARAIENAVRSATRQGSAPGPNKKSWSNWFASFGFGGGAAPQRQAAPAAGGSFLSRFKLPTFGTRAAGTRRRFRWPWERRVVGVSGPYYVWDQGRWVPTPVGSPPPQPQPIPTNTQPPAGTTIFLNPNGTGGIAIPVAEAEATRAAANASAAANAATQAANKPGAPPEAKAKANAAVQAANAANNAANKAANAPNANAAKAAANAAKKAANAAVTAAGGAGGSATGGTGGGASVTGPTITFSPSIQVGLNKLPQAVQQARNDPSKMANLMRLVNNLKAKLPANSATQQTIQQLFKQPNKLPTSTQVQTAFKSSYKNMNLNELLALRAGGKNRAMVNAQLREAVRTQIRRIGRLSGAERSTYMAELYRSLPKNFAGRAEVERELVKEVRALGLRTSGGYGGYGGGRSPYESRGILNGLRRNFGSSLPPRLREEMRVQERRIMERQGPLRQNIGGRRNERGLAAEGALRQRGVRPNSNRPLAAQAALRQTGFGAPGPKLLSQGLLKQGGPQLNIGLGQPLAPLPPNQQSAITKAGGHQTAIQTIAAVPGGAPQVALAAQALNETNGNRQQALERGVKPEAINAVQRLGGPTNTGYVLEGLNTLAQTRKTQVRKAAVSRKRKVKPTSLRLNELNNVINAVKKRKLISLVAHNVTHTGIHNNENRKKKYYKKVIKSSILRRPLANKVRAAAKKTSNVKAKAGAKKT